MCFDFVLNCVYVQDCMCFDFVLNFVIFVDECAVIVCTVCAGLPGGPARWLKGHFLSKIKIYLSIYLSIYLFKTNGRVW